jgi:hypothetical protein
MNQPTPDFQLSFLSNLQRLLAEGSFVATYKYALLMALADLCVEQGREDVGPLELSTRSIAEKFIQYYWRQGMPFVPQSPDGQEAVLRQNSGRQAAIIRLVMDARRRHAGSLPGACRDEPGWNGLVSDVDDVVRVMPLWKLQTVGRERLDFLYANTGRGKRIVLKPGVAFCFRTHYAMVADLIRGAWARYVRRFNLAAMGNTTDLHEFLFGSERSSLAAVKPILYEFQRGECFYCRRPLRDDTAHVDHFVPWSRYPVDLGHNFVLAHATCNGKKSDRLACAEHLNAWVEHAARFAKQMGREFDRNGIVHYLPTSVRIARWAYGQTFNCQGLTWVRMDELQGLPPDWDQTLRQLLN